MAQIVTLPTSHDIRNAKNFKGEKFLVQSLKLLVTQECGPRDRDRPIDELAELCVWTGVSPSASKFYASLWVHSDPYYISGHGTASGYGYCKASAASSGAFDSAGIKLSEPIGGAGMEVVERAMYALGAALGYCQKKLYVVRGA